MEFFNSITSPTTWPVFTTRYSSVEKDSMDEPLEPMFTTEPRKSSLLRILTVLSTLMFVFCGVWGAFDLSLRLFQAMKPAPDHSCHCGASVEEAISMGCKFDLLSSAWLPDHCIDADLSREFAERGPNRIGSWVYYKDKTGSSEVKLQDLGQYAERQGDLFWTTHEWHIMQCVYNWRKLHRPVTMEARYNTEEYASHCAHTFLEYRPLQDIAFGQFVALDSGPDADIM